MFVCSSSSQWLCVACPKSDSATGGTGVGIQILRRDGKLSLPVLHPGELAYLLARCVNKVHCGHVKISISKDTVQKP